MSPDSKTVWCMRVCVCLHYKCVHPHGTSACISLVMEASVVLQGGGRSFIFWLIRSVVPLRLRAFDQAEVMFVRFAASVAITAVRNLACLGEVEIPSLYLKQAEDKRSMGQFRL